MEGLEHFNLHTSDYCTFGAYFAMLCIIGWWSGRKEKQQADDYFLAGRRLPWYVVGGSFTASNISSEHFIGMIGTALVWGICVANWCWLNVWAFSMLVWFFIPFLLASKVFTTPEFLEKRFNVVVRQFFAVVTILANVTAFLAAVLYGGGLALTNLFGWPLWFSIVTLGVVAGVWAIYGGLNSVAWTDLFTLAIMLLGGTMVTILGLYMLSGADHSMFKGFAVMLERNRAQTGVWAQAVAQNVAHMVDGATYNRLSLFQPASHKLMPWPSLILGWLSISIWYNVINQFMIQRVLGAKNGYHARMGIVFAGFLQVLLPFIVIVPGLILFAWKPEIMLLPWKEIQPAADQGYVTLLKTLVPVGLRGLFLAALFGAIQSTVNSVLNSTATIFTIDIYKRMFRPRASEEALIRTGMWSSFVVLVIAIVLAGNIGKFGGSLFVYIQTLYAFFAPPFAAVFLLGIMWRRINGKGATAAVFSGFVFGIGLKAFVGLRPGFAPLLEPFMNQAIVNWSFCMVVCIVVSLLTAPPRPDQITHQTTVDWHRINIFDGLGSRWYASVWLWWGLFVLSIIALAVVFSGRLV